MSDYRLRLLHISDLYLGKGQPDEARRARRVLGDARLCNMDEIVQDGHTVGPDSGRCSRAVRLDGRRGPAAGVYHRIHHT